MKKWIIITTSFTAIALIVFFVLRENSYMNAIRSYGYDQVLHIAGSEIDDNGDLVRIVAVSNDDDPYHFILVTKNAFGFWSLTSAGNTGNSDSELDFISFVKTAGIKRYSASDRPEFETEWNYYYHGTNAKKLIEFNDLELPDNMTVNVQQTGEEYFLHFVYYGESIDYFDLNEILIQGGVLLSE